MTQQRLNAMQASPELFKKMADYSLAIKKGALDATLLHLVDIRTSQINGCALCLDMHIKQAKLHGEGELRLHHLAIWRESPLYSERERAALAWTEVLTGLPRTVWPTPTTRPRAPCSPSRNWSSSRTP